jgi:hypothetical protein
MRRGPSRHACRCTAERLRRALPCLALGAALGLTLAGLLAPAQASTVRVRYEGPVADRDRPPAGTEAEIKAAFLLKFPDFVSWQPSLGETLRVGVIGDDALLNALPRLADQEQRAAGAGRTVVVFRVAGPGDARHCHILVLGEDADRLDLAPILSAAHRAGALTVGDWNRPREGAVIRIFREGDHVRFVISQPLAREAGLRISSKLLNLSRDQTRWVSPAGDALAQR